MLTHCSWLVQTAAGRRPNATQMLLPDVTTLITRTAACAMVRVPWKGRYKSPLFCFNLGDNIIPTTTTFHICNKPPIQSENVKQGQKTSIQYEHLSSAKMPQHRPETPQPESPLPTEPDTSEGDGTADYWGATQTQTLMTTELLGNERIRMSPLIAEDDCRYKLRNLDWIDMPGDDAWRKRLWSACLFAFLF